MTASNNTLQQLAESATGNPTRLNENFDAMSQAATFGRNPVTTTGLTWGYLGGSLEVDGAHTVIASGTVALTASQTNYVEATRAGTVSANTTGFTAGRLPLYVVTTGTSSITAYADHRRMVATPGISSRLSKSVAGAADVTLTAAEARCEVLNFTGLLTGNISVVVPNGPQRWVVANNTTGAFTLTVKTSAGTGVAVAQSAAVTLLADGTNVISTSSGGGAVTSVAGKTGAVTIDSGDIADFAEAVDDRVGTLLVAGTNVTLTYDDGAGTLTIDATGGGGDALGWINVKDAAYGATGDGTTDDTTAVGDAVAAINALAEGGVLYFPAGTYKTSGGFAFTKRVRILGDGCAGSSLTGSLSGITSVTNTSTTADLFSFSVAGSQIEHIHLNDAVPGTRTAGAGLIVSSGLGLRIANLSTYGFQDAIKLDDGFEWSAHDFFIYGPIRYGMYLRNTVLPDAGDAAISNGHIVAVDRSGTSAIRIESGGGVKLSNVKINDRPGSYRFVNGVDLAVAASVSTSILLLSNCSIENTSQSAVKARCGASANWNHIVLSGCQFSQYHSTTYPCVDIVGISGAGLDRIVINGCTFQGAGASVPAITLDTVDNVNLLGNIYDDFTALYSATNCSSVEAGISATQTGEMMSGFIASPSNKDYKVVVKAAHAGTITETTTICASGTCTATFKVNSTALGGTANAVSSAEQSQAHASSNTFAAGDDIVITVSANSSCTDMSFSIKYTRTLA